MSLGLARTGRWLLNSRVVSALAVPHGVDRYLGLVNPLWSTHEVRAVVVDVAHHTADSVTITLRPNGNWAGAQAGQYVRLAVEIDGARRTRCFSVASSAHRADGLIEITTKVNPAGAVSRYLKQHARPGLRMVLSPAEGEFTLPARVPERLLLISGGSGITPVMSILRTLIDQRYPGRITFLHYARTPADVIYRAELAALAAARPRLTLVNVYTRSPGASRFSGERLGQVAPDYAKALTYVCGPAPLLEAVAGLWRAEGIADRLMIERFTLVSPVVDTENAVGTVRFTRSGVSARNDGRTVLEQAEAAGLRPEHGCRMGICHTCVALKTIGSVRDVRNDVISAEPDERIQLCVTAPCGDVELDL
ncbi:MAG TPA: ferredoxin reductase [Pseudonocardiaceae bacterium]|nr:ferredoxin reductase [Pseudonocardiaceae bacterium]